MLRHASSPHLSKKSLRCHIKNLYMSRKIFPVKKCLQKSSTKFKALIPSVQKSNRNNSIKKANEVSQRATAELYEDLSLTIFSVLQIGFLGTFKLYIPQMMGVRHIYFSKMSSTMEHKLQAGYMYINLNII